jgi:HD-like signal output (HDOD) protein
VDENLRMKKWLARLFGGSDDKESLPAAAPTPAAGSAAPEPPRQADVDLLFYRWLTGADGSDGPSPAEALILDELARLVRAPGAAAGLVPRMPAVVPQLLRSLRDESVSGAELARQVAQDVVLVAEVIREANSPYFRPPQPVRTIEAAVMLLGQNGLRMLLARVAFRPVLNMQGGRLARQAAPHVWSHSEKCALAASLLAPALGADPFEAFLAGLMQNVGLVVAFRVADQVCQEQPPPRSPDFCAGLLASGRALSAAIARHWEFPESVIHAIAQAGQAGAGPLPAALAQGDLLARLRVLLDAGVLAPDDQLLRGLAPAQRRCFDKLRIEEN